MNTAPICQYSQAEPRPIRAFLAKAQDALVLAPVPTVQQQLAAVLEHHGHDVFPCATSDEVSLLVRSGTPLRIIVIALLPSSRRALEPLETVQNELTLSQSSSLPQFLVVSFIESDPDIEIKTNNSGAHFVSAIHAPFEELIRKIKLINRLLDSQPFASIDHT